MLRRLIKNGVANALQHSGVGDWLGTRSKRASTTLILGYHRVVDDFRAHAAASIPPMLISTHTFERHLDWVGRHYDFVSLDAAAWRIATGETGGRPTATITFDDGYSDVYQNAFPLLKRKGIPSAMFVVTDLVGTDRLQLHDELYALLSMALTTWQQPIYSLRKLLQGIDGDAEPMTMDMALPEDAFGMTRVLLNAVPQKRLQGLVEALRGSMHGLADRKDGFQALDWKQLAEMQRAGVTIGSHTCSHALLSNEPLGTVRHEVSDSRSLLEEKLGIRVEHFAYPDGRFNPPAVDEVAGAGYRYAYTTCPHSDARHPRLTLPRRVLWEGSCRSAFGSFSPAVMHCQVNGIFDAGTSCSSQHQA